MEIAAESNGFMEFHKRVHYVHHGMNTKTNSAVQKSRCQQEIGIHTLFLHLDF